MSIIPEGEELRRAVKWICDRMETEGADRQQLINDAAQRFNLSPLDEEFLDRHVGKAIENGSCKE